MSEFIKQAEQTALWRRWRQSAEHATEAPDPMLLAAWAEHRLDEASAEAVEAWLAFHPEALEDALAARNVAPPIEASVAAIARGSALVAQRDPKIVPLRRGAPAWRVAATWTSMAASIVIACLVGFELGGGLYAGVLGGGQSDIAFEQTLLDGPAPLFSDFDEEIGS
ncbi:MAG TPA: hypothetical protein VMG55_06210 [Stellaceae bacterium]|nr:hypothetical protein [Stellaceae bacterium]